ncbi:hypothetical protein NIIDMKKI_30100 [Mycobacterium kansasii]|uniref:Lipoprotein lppJ n=2 Tax=Mycobacterium kansasii TaxID=1768 RepID=A0A7G1IBI6_MYCKA|nr:hypothetical protein NIIDMKKI_30100 [Mycobacterium kansasii]
MYPFAHDADHPEHPLSDEQAMAQVIEPAKQITKVAGLRDVSGGFSWESCNDQGDPPYRGRVDMTFNVPPASITAPTSSKSRRRWWPTVGHLEHPQDSTCSERRSTTMVSWQLLA